MVFVEDTGSVFNVPFDMVWKLRSTYKRTQQNSS